MFENFIIRILQNLLPDWQNAEEVRQFVLKIVGYLEDLAASTVTTVDDKVLETLKTMFLQDAQQWATLYGFLLDLLSGSESVKVGDATNPRIVAMADEKGIDPATIILIIKAILQAIQWWRNR
jgi:hypothetical protein